MYGRSSMSLCAANTRNTETENKIVKSKIKMFHSDRPNSKKLRHKPI